MSAPTRRLEMIPDMASRLRILLVEDYPDCANAMATLLRLHGYEVRVADDGQQALEVAVSYEPHAVLLDLKLPGISGYDVARELKQRLPARPLLIAVSGYGREDDRRRSAEAGIDFHLVKPADYHALEAILRDFQARGRPCGIPRLSR